MEKQAELRLQFHVVLLLRSQWDWCLSDPCLIAKKVKDGPLDEDVSLFLCRQDNKLCARPGLDNLIKEPGWQRLTKRFPPLPPSSFNWMSASWSELRNGVCTLCCLILLKFLFHMLKFSDCSVAEPSENSKTTCTNAFGPWPSLIFVMFIYMSPKRQFGGHATILLLIFAGCMYLCTLKEDCNCTLTDAWTTIQNALQQLADYLGTDTYAVVIWVTKVVVALILVTWFVKSASRCSKDTLVSCVAMGVAIVLCIISQYLDRPTLG